MKDETVLVFDCFGLFAGDAMVQFFNNHYGPGSAPLKDSFCDGADLGKVSFGEVIERMHVELGFDKDEIVKELSSLAKPNLAMIDAVIDLRKRHRVVLLSNCIDGLMERYFEGTRFFECFDKMYRSYEIGLIKPYPEIYRYVMNDIAPKGPVYFFDDNPRNLPEARNAGMEATLFEGYEKMLQFLHSHGIE